MIKVVYFNQWFSSIKNVIDDLKDKYGSNIKLIASSRNRDHAYRYSVDTFKLEDWEISDDNEISMNNYVDWLLKLCKEYKVDYFFVKKHAKDVMKRASEFIDIGVYLISDDYNTLLKLDSKSNVYYMFQKEKDLNWLIPEHHIFNKEDALDYLNEHKGKNDICLKFDSDEGGASFRAINDNAITLGSLYGYRVNTLRTTEAEELVNNADEKIGKILFMEMLDNPEISVDCYNSKQGFIAICRSKEEGRREKVYFDKEIYKICEKICKTLNLKFPFNVQFRVKHDENRNKLDSLRLLEINPRMSGGLYYEVFYGLNIAEVVLLDMMNRSNEYKINDYIGFDEKYVGHVEYPIHLES